MKNYLILADATCDLTEEFQQKYDIEVVPAHITLPDKTQISSFSKWEQFDRDEFYADLKKHPNDYTTAPPNISEFTEYFEKFASVGYDMLVITISGGMSGTYNFASQAAKTVMEKYPGVKIMCVDSLRFGPGFGLLAVYASILRSQGKTLEENAADLEKNKNRIHQAGWLDDLNFTAKKGRINQSKAFFGTLAGIKPIGEFDYNGLTTVIGKAKGAKKAYEVLLGYIEKTIENPEDQIIFIAQTSRYPQAVEYKRLIEEKFHPKEIYINDVFPSCGINIGPGLMAAYYFGKEISKDLSEERKILEELS